MLDRVGSAIGAGTLVALSLLATGGCATEIWFTQSVREGYALGLEPRSAAPSAIRSTLDDDTSAPSRTPAALQYYVSERVVLERELTSRDAGIAAGRIRVKRGRVVEKVVIRRNTPGIAVDWGPDWVAVSFEEGSALVFALDAADGTPNEVEVYHLRRREDARGRASTTLAGHGYRLRRGRGAKLEVQRLTHTKRARRRSVQRGRKVERNGEGE